jgi:hypothetical protein
VAGPWPLSSAPERDERLVRLDRELSGDADLFNPLHAAHLVERCPQIGPYLDLPLGSRFLIAPGCEDAWTDESLLDV